MLETNEDHKVSEDSLTENFEQRNDIELTSSSPDSMIENDVKPNTSSDSKRIENNSEPSLPSSPYKYELKKLIQISNPIILGEIFQNTLPIIDVAFVGQLDKNDLAACALATAWFNLWNATMVGFMTAIDTYLAQSYGTSDKKGFCSWSIRGIILTFFMTCLSSSMVALCGITMKIIGQDPILSEQAGQFSYRLIPGLFPYYIFKVLTKYLQTQNILLPSVLIGFFANIFNIGFNWLLIYHLGYGIHGAPWATTLTRLAEFLMIIAYITLWKKNDLIKESLYLSLQPFKDSPEKGLFTQIFTGIEPFFRLGISGALSVAAEAWSFEVTTIMAGYLGTIELDAHLITLAIATFVYLSFPFAIGIATSIRVGQLIGDQKPKEAKKAGHVSFVISIGVQLLLICLLIPSSNFLGDLFSSEREVSDLVAELLPISCIFMIGDTFHSTSSGIMRGLGRQKLVLFLNGLGFCILALPIGALLTFLTPLRVKGLWVGFIIGIDVSALIGVVLLRYRINFEVECKKSIERLSTIQDNQILH
eukprot:CAMPEP_0178955338 /NCGR_PEP_ID=MMETSP0789-20121207/9544_1 /TAXON_ID=3005 /ORGANISM="Rhizosolenia setigera, Strain CCMP 1694" /LENGTH=532 /DNA_ID=CAMNT_0020636947 /DNA_START=53 /DNA_END=1651 /DNA_ORIENTATION=-